MSLGDPGVSEAERRAAAPPPKKPKFPGAKTYKDKDGNIREVGTGKLIRKAAPKAVKAAPAAAPKKGNTHFIDGQGVVRRIGTAKNGAPAIAKNPLDRQVDEAILVESAPLRTSIDQANSQFGAERTSIQGAGTALASQLAALQNRIATLGSQQLGAAANAAGGTADQHQANLSYLQGLLGGANSGTADFSGAITGLAAGAQGEAAGANRGLAMGQVGMQSDLATMGGASAMQYATAVKDRELARNAAVKEYNDKIAAVKAGRTKVKNDLVNTSLDQALARQEMKLNQAEFDFNKKQYGDSLTQQEFENSLAEDELALSAATGGGKGGKDAESNIATYAGVRLPAGQIQAVGGAVASWKGEKKGRSFNTLTSKLVQLGGLSKVMAARVAMGALTPAEVKRFAGSRSSFEKSLTALGVNAPTVAGWSNKVYGRPTARPEGGGAGGTEPARPPTGAVSPGTATGEDRQSIQSGVASAIKNNTGVSNVLRGKKKGQKVRIAGTALTIARIDRIRDDRLGIDRAWNRYHLKDAWGKLYRFDFR
jgi:hypothetical protein